MNRAQPPCGTKPLSKIWRTSYYKSKINNAKLCSVRLIFISLCSYYKLLRQCKHNNFKTHFPTSEQKRTLPYCYNVLLKKTQILRSYLNNRIFDLIRKLITLRKEQFFWDLWTDMKTSVNILMFSDLPSNKSKLWNKTKQRKEHWIQWNSH